jgi:dolichyl-phosphate-mannose--protein O-mannosyl transferase
MPKLISLYIRNILIGFVVSLVFVGLLLGLNIANLRHLILSSDIGYIALALLIVFNTIVFGAVQFAITVMGMADDDSDSSGGKGTMIPLVNGEMIPVRVEQGSRHTGR